MNNSPEFSAGKLLNIIDSSKHLSVMNGILLSDMIPGTENLIGIFSILMGLKRKNGSHCIAMLKY